MEGIALAAVPGGKQALTLTGESEVRVLVPTYYFWQQALINTEAATPSPGLPGILHGATVMLYDNVVALTNSTLLAALTPAVYSGYAAQNAAFGTPFQRTEGGMAVLSATLTFQMSGGTTGDTIYGFGIVDSAGTHLLGAGSFGPGGITLTTVLQAINLICEVAMGGPDWGNEILAF